MLDKNNKAARRFKALHKSVMDKFLQFETSLKPIHDKQLGRLKVISLDPTIKEIKKRRNRVKLFLTILSIKPKTEHVAKRCRMPKNM